MKMTYDDFEPGKYYIDEGGSYCLVGTPNIQTLTKNLHWFPHHNVGAVIPDGFVRNMIGECDRDGNLIEPKGPCSECERLKEMVKELESKLKDKETARARMQSQRDHMSAKLAELTGYTPKEVRDGVKLLALGIKDKLAVKQDPDMVTFDGIPGKWFSYTAGDTLPFQERTLFQTITESERVCPSDWDDYEHYFNVNNWDDIVAYRPADREDMR